jgi:soluble lytic murein transglycosylase-like protein
VKRAVVYSLVIGAGITAAYFLFHKDNAAVISVSDYTDEQALSDLENQDSISETIAAAGDSYVAESDPITAAISDYVIDPIKDTIVTITRNVFGTPYDDLIASSASANGIPEDVLYKLLKTESAFRPEIIDGRKKSSTGALGIAQFMPATAIQELGSVAAALDPLQAIPGAARYLAKLRASLGGDLTKAVAAYNWGIGRVKKYGLNIAYVPAETQNYVRKILGVELA